MVKEKTPFLNRGDFNIFFQPLVKASKRKNNLRRKKLRGPLHPSKPSKSKLFHLAKLLQEEVVIEEDLKADLEEVNEPHLSEGDISPSSDLPPSNNHFNLLAKIPFPLLVSPPIVHNNLDLTRDQNAQKLLQDFMIGDEDTNSILDTPLVVLYSQIKEKRKLGLHQNQEGLEKLDFGSSPPNKVRKSFIEARSQDDATKNQSKLSDLWNVGKGNPLPEQQ